MRRVPEGSLDAAVHRSNIKTTGLRVEIRERNKEKKTKQRGRKKGGLPVLFQRITAHTAIYRIPAGFRHINGRHPARTRVPAIYLTVPPRFG
jgi:hypothetical protein